MFAHRAYMMVRAMVAPKTPLRLRDGTVAKGTVLSIIVEEESGVDGEGLNCASTRSIDFLVPDDLKEQLVGLLVRNL